MSAPLETPEFKTLFVGNMRDDDALIIDENVQQDPNIDISTATEPIPVQPLIKPFVLTRLFTGFMTLTPTWDPVLILPGDPHRLTVHFEVTSTTATDGISLANSKEKLAYDPNISPVVAPSQAFRILASKAWNLDGHTGPIWASAAASTNPVAISWVAVTL